MSKNRKSSKTGDSVPLFKTQALSEDIASRPRAKEATPSYEAIKEAKDWVDFNKK